MLIRARVSLRTLALALIPSSLVAFIATWATINDSWHWLRVYHAYGAIFADLRQVTATADCVLSDAAWSMASATCDPFGRDYNYPSVWARGFAMLGLGEAKTEQVAILMIGAFIAAVFAISLLSVWLVRPLVPIMCVAVAAVAPPTWLALERGNIDIVVFAAVVLGALLSLLQISWLSAILLAIASVAKIFPVGAALILLRQRRQHPRSLWLFLALVTGGFALIVSELPLISQRTPQPTEAAFGSSIFFQYLWNHLDLPFASLAPRLLGVVLFAGVLLALMILVARFSRVKVSVAETVEAVARDRISATLVLSGGGPLICAYLLGTNFDYRLVFAIPLVAGLARAATRTRVPTSLLLTALISQLWFTYPTPIWIQRFSDLLWVVLAPFVALVLLRVMRSPSHTGANRELSQEMFGT